jgi:isopentenyl diphosphate isomerase/L-lactate dehydrogenase-like FMN-dependent dehydrogenase
VVVHRGLVGVVVRVHRVGPVVIRRVTGTRLPVAIVVNAFHGWPTPNYDLQTRRADGMPVWLNINILARERSEKVPTQITHLIRDIIDERSLEGKAPTVLAAIQDGGEEGSECRSEPERNWSRCYSSLTGSSVGFVTRIFPFGSSSRPTRRHPVSPEFLSNEEIIQAARRNMDQPAWDYLVGGSESETTMRRNRLGFDRLAFRPRILVDVSDIDMSATFLGHKLRVPVILAPVGGLVRFNPEGGIAAAQAASEFGILQAVSAVAGHPLQAIAAANDDPQFYQLYVHGDWAWIAKALDEVKEAGYAGLILTVDSARGSRRERPMVHGSSQPRGSSPFDGPHQAALTWATMDRIKDYTGLPFMLKGVATAEDATLAVEHGVDVVWISNHGGRQLDQGQGTIEMLPEIVAAVDGKAEIILDGGIVRGADVVKALALGADAVAIGKLQGWGLGAGGKGGLLNTLEILEDELLRVMAMLGAPSIEKLGPSHVIEGQSVTQPHEMSAWVNMPGGRIL